MNRFSPGEMFDLQPAGKTGGHDYRFRIGLAQRRKEALLAHQTRDFVMFFVITKRTSHTAATGVQIDYLRARNASQEI